MILFSTLLVPLLAVLILLIWFKETSLWWHYLLPFASAIVVSLIFKVSIETAATSDTEYWSGTIVNTAYYEAWNEYIHKECSEDYDCGKDKDGNTIRCTRYYDCSYVEYHSPYWTVTDNNGITINVAKSVYDRLVKKFGNNNFVELNRNYHTQDGDMYLSTWPRTDETLECMVTQHNYKNRVQASRDIFNFPEVDTSDIKIYGLYDYPEITGYYDQVNLLGSYENKNFFNHKLEILNAKLGAKKQVKTFMLLFRNKPIEAALKQESYWKGGNKNELVVCIGLDNESNVKWAHVFSWTENQIVKINIRTNIEQQEKFNLSQTIDYMYTEIDNNFIRKKFKDFNYLTIEPTSGELIWAFIVTIIVNVIIMWVIIVNESYNTEYRSNKYKF